MSAPNTVTFTAWLKDQMTGPMEKMRVKSEAAFGKIRSSLGKISYESKTTVTSIDSINRELDKLRASRKIMVDASSIKMANKEISILEAKKIRLETAGTSSGGGMGMISKMGLYGLAIGAAYKGVQFLKDSVGEFNVDAQVKAQLAAGLKSTGGVSGKTVSGMTSQAEDLQNVTLIKHTDTEAADKILLTFTKVRNEIFDKSIPLLQDMSTKMELNLPQAALQLGKALQDPIKGIMALRREGVVLSEHQKKQIEYFVKTNQLAKAQGIILGELQTEFGGSARAAAKAGTGGLTILKNNFTDLKEIIGAKLMPVLGGMGTQLGKIVSNAKEYMKIGIADKLREEKTNVDGLVALIKDQNTPAERRNELYQDLINIAPQFSQALKDEKIDYDELNKQLLTYNGQMEKKITLGAMKDVSNKYTSEATEAYKNIEERKTSILTDIDKITNALIAQKNPITKYLKQIRDSFDSGKTDIFNYTESFMNLTEALSDDKNDIGNRIENIKAKLYGTSFYIPILGSRDDIKSLPGMANKLTELKGGIKNAEDEYNKAFSAMGFPIDKPITTGKGGNGTNPLDPHVETINGDISKVKNINITIHKLGGDITYTNTTVKESAESIKDAITEVLLTAVNDANLIDS